MSVAVVVSFCSLGDNAALHFVQATVAATPLALWIALSGFAYVTHEWYFFIYAHTYLAVYMVQAIVGQLLGWLHDAPDPLCNNAAWVGPATGAALVGAFVTQAAINSIALRVPITWLRFAWKLVLVAAVLVVPTINGNTTWAQAFAGLGLGTAVGAVAMWLLWQVWMPLLPALDRSGILVKWLQLHACRDLRELYYRDMCTYAGGGGDHAHHWGTRWGVARDQHVSALLMV
jgi:hypothetical protein